MTGTPISSIRNLGPAIESACHRAGIPDAETLRALGADTAYARMLATGTRPHFVGYFVLHMALQGRPWNDCVGMEKQKLRQRFDALKARPVRVADGDIPLGIETILDRIGVRARS
ncbi:TfoX/Sxy family protein [Salipiger aestuarii]|uniref:TfoX-like protein n=1 Tax=Salipiger aestuarii TaxID=568098 RepID=A0A327Y3Z0_9RHOB|nr:TfoX/Sxy family protein [Salipiger aestuarii]KAA8608831.1 competence protein TfoX [Salipiger aestuarii]KAB2540785.1 competence protein TfoX [Salipiger aestuarii]RAK15032.1 TfoX-like protein [Salipiger aestuarii]